MPASPSPRPYPRRLLLAGFGWPDDSRACAEIATFCSSRAIGAAPLATIPDAAVAISGAEVG